MAIDRGTLTTLAGICGNIISFGLFLSPLPTLIRICKQKAVHAFKPDPYLATTLNCIMWLFYGLPLVTKDNLLVITINSAGLIMELGYVTIFFIYSPWAKRRRITYVLIFEVVFAAVVVFVTLFFFHSLKDRAMIVGILCIVFNVIMYTSPLTVMKMVIKTKSVKYMPFTLSLANFVNGCIWSLYAILKRDTYVLIPNALGTLSGVVQLVMYAVYYKTTNWDEDDEEDIPQEVQLSNNA
ncbi:bidirectional sugar transporter SWEET5-like [Mangifera indica]|uniref:bidirectional sugar transporter SWEET5-like n=1 Tax=Mangifera indica TaxID=29780 RepID=UPI001CFB7A6B|nr:bidirectional sugar transporter SWEET5-like [Mangifera indica]XP_044479697.1 bidirectional sugar transporter SWEET5-like [Mangifera indica]